MIAFLASLEILMSESQILLSSHGKIDNSSCLSIRFFTLPHSSYHSINSFFSYFISYSLIRLLDSDMLSQKWIAGNDHSEYQPGQKTNNFQGIPSEDGAIHSAEFDFLLPRYFLQQLSISIIRFFRIVLESEQRSISFSEKNERVLLRSSFLKITTESLEKRRRCPERHFEKWPEVAT